MRVGPALRLTRLLLLLGLLAGCVPHSAAVALEKPGSGQGSLTISGSVSGYATFTIKRPTVLHYMDTELTRTGAYAGAVIDVTTVVMSSSAWPDAGANMFWNGSDRRLRKAGTYRAYLFTEPGRYAKVEIPWDGPSVSLTVSKPVSHEKVSTHRSRTMCQSYV